MPELLDRARQLNPELQHLGQEQRVEDSRRALLKAERIPNLAVQVGSDFNAPPDFRAGPRGALAMELPIFNRNQGEIARTGYALTQAQEQRQSASDTVLSDVANAYVDGFNRILVESSQAQVNQEPAYITSALGRVNEELQNVEAQLKRFEEKHHLANLEAEPVADDSQEPGASAEPGNSTELG